MKVSIHWFFVLFLPLIAQAQIFPIGGVSIAGSGTFVLPNPTPSPFPAPACITGETPPSTSNSYIALGEYHSCAVVPGGKVKCWGNGFYGNLGNNSFSSLPTSPTTVVSTSGTGALSNIVSVSTGDDTSCALSNVGNVYCWGYVNTTAISIPTLLTTNAKQLSVGAYHVCVLTNAGNVTCWYRGSLTPQQITGFSTNVVAISAGGYHACALMGNGTVQCWLFNVAGYNNTWGQLGNGSTTNSFSPTTVVSSTGFGSLSGVLSVVAGDIHTCAQLINGLLACWGDNAYGELGDGTTNQSSRPVLVLSNTGLPLTNVCTILGHRPDRHTCVLSGTQGDMLCWGNNYNGQLGIGTTGGIRTIPTQVSGLTSGVIAASTASDIHSCAILNTGRAVCWGNNNFGELGTGNTIDYNIPTSVINYP